MISVIVPCYNGAALVRRCLDSVFAQTRKPGEVIVVNDGSTDNSAQIVTEYSSSVRYFEQTNQGPAAARNVGFHMATGKYVALLDADDYWLPEFLAKCVEFLEAHPEAVAVSVGQKIKTWGHKECICPAILAADSPSGPKESCVLDDFFAFWAEHNHITTGSNVIRKDVIDQTGGQRPELRICEDLELWGYLATFGKWGFIPEVLFVSDGTAAAAAQGWMARHHRRWQSAPMVESWEQRIAPRLTERDWPGFRRVRGRIAKNIAFSKILGGDAVAAHATVLRYGGDFPKDRIASILRFGATKGPLAWLGTCAALRWRERIKAWLMSARLA